MLINKALTGGVGAQGRSSIGIQVRTIGRDDLKVVPFAINNHKRAEKRRVGQRMVANAEKPYFLTRADQAFHFSGNSVCYALQWALIMEADPIYLMGFTLQSGSPYEFGQTNPATKKPAFYNDLWRPLEWLEEFERRWPGRARLLPGWNGPIYDVLSTDQPKTTVTPWAT